MTRWSLCADFNAQPQEFYILNGAGEEIARLKAKAPISPAIARQTMDALMRLDPSAIPTSVGNVILGAITHMPDGRNTRCQSPVNSDPTRQCTKPTHRHNGLFCHYHLGRSTQGTFATL